VCAEIGYECVCRNDIRLYMVRCVTARHCVLRNMIACRNRCNIIAKYDMVVRIRHCVCEMGYGVYGIGCSVY
jgi:hypothetical protein